MEGTTKRSTALRPVSRRELLRMLGLAAGAAAAAPILSACGPKAAPTSAPAPTTAGAGGEATTAPQPTAAPAEPIVLRYQNHWSKETDAHYEGMNWLYKEFHAKYPDIRIENILNPDSEASRQKILADCAAGDCPDIIHESGDDMWGAGSLLDLTPYLDADPEWKALFSQDTLDAFSTDGQVWGLSAEMAPMPTIWNTRNLTAAGAGDVPKTWDEMLAACEKIKASGKLATSWGVGGAHLFHDIIISQKGGKDALAANQFDAPQVVEAFKLMKVFVDNKWIPDNEIELTWQQSLAIWVGEQSTFYLNGAWTIGNEITGQGAAPDLKDNVKFAPAPKVGEVGTTVEVKVGTPIGLAKKLDENPAKVEAAITFMKFLFSPEGAKQWILLTKSPMGVKVDLRSITGVDPLLMAFLGTLDQADTVYSLPPTKAMRERGWDDCWTALQALMAGKSVEEAVAVYQTEMSKYVG